MVYEPVMRSYTGPDASKIFVEWLEKDIKIIANIPKKDVIFGKEEAERFNKETECWICKEDFKEDDKNKKVKNHCHFTGSIEESHTTNVTLNILYLNLHL